MTALTTTPDDDLWVYGGRGGRQRMIPDADTGELRPYQRVSTFAKTLDDKEGLIAWKAWMALRGAESEPDLLRQALHAERTPKGVIDRLADAGGAKDAARKGTDRHQILAMALHGMPLPSDMPADARDEVDAILGLVFTLGRVTAVEAPTVNDRWQVCGTVDLVLEGPSGPVVCDFKTGSRSDTLAWSIQLIAHARAWYWDNDAQRRLGLVAAALPRLVVIHAPQDGTPPRAIDLDVPAASGYADLAATVRDARKQAAKTDRSRK